MGANENIKAVQAMYEAFGRGDLGTILDTVTDDVDWSAEAASSTAVPWYGPRRGKDEVASFFEAFGSSMEVNEFTPVSIGANDEDVFAVVRCRTTARSTGTSVDMLLHHFFRFREGKVWYYRGSEDTAQVEAALRG